MNPQFTIFGEDNTHKAVTLNGKTTAPGKITSPTLTGGISVLRFNYTKLFTDTKLSITVTITGADGNSVSKDLAVELDKNDKYTLYEFEWVLEAPVEGDFTIEIVNNCPSNNSSSNKDRISIWYLTWN